MSRIPPELEAEMTPAVKAAFLALLDRIDELETQVKLPTKEGQEKAWLWVAVAPWFAVFGVFANRSRESLVALIGDYRGIILNCDRAKMPNIRSNGAMASDFNGVGRP